MLYWKRTTLDAVLEMDHLGCCTVCFSLQNQLKGEAHIGKPHSKLTPTFLSHITGLRITAKSLF